MRSTEEMKRLVHREAAHRRARRRALVAGGAGALVLILVTAAVARAGTGDSAEVSTASDGAPPTAETASTATPSTTAGPTSPGTVVVVDETGETVVIAAGAAPPTTDPRTTAPRSTTSVEPTPDSGATTTTAPSSPSTSAAPPVSAGPATTAPPTSPPSTAPPVRTCTADDIVRAPIQIFVPSAADWTGGSIPAGHVVQFGYSTLARSDITPCRTPDSRQVLSITDGTGTEVFRHTFDGGPGRVITPGAWVMFRGSVSWDPSCATPAPLPFVWDPCLPSGPGTYTVDLTDQGVVYPPISLSIRPAP